MSTSLEQDLTSQIIYRKLNIPFEEDCYVEYIDTIEKDNKGNFTILVEYNKQRFTFKVGKVHTGIMLAFQEAIRNKSKIVVLRTIPNGTSRKWTARTPIDKQAIPQIIQQEEQPNDIRSNNNRMETTGGSSEASPGTNTSERKTNAMVSRKIQRNGCGEDEVSNREIKTDTRISIRSNKTSGNPMKEISVKKGLADKLKNHFANQKHDSDPVKFEGNQ